MSVMSRIAGAETSNREGAGARRWWALAAITSGVLAVGLDATVLSLALPTLATSLHATESDLQWFASGYALALAAGMLPAGLFGDRYGRKKVIQIALAMFGLGSIACAYAPSPAAFIAARVVLGAAGAGLVVMALSALTVLFLKAERPRAVGIWGAANFVALPIGPILGGWLITHVWWGWVFLMNVPVAMLGLIAVSALVPESRAAERPRLDPFGLLTSSAGLVALTYGLIEAGRNGWGDARALLALALGMVVMVAFILWERRQSRLPGGQPLVDLTLFGSRSFTWGVILSAVAILPMFGVIFTMPQYFQGVLGVNAQGAGVRLVPVIIGLVLGAVPADRVAARVGVKITVALGFTVMAAGMLLGATTRIGSSDGFVEAWLAVVGIGMGLTVATAASAALVEIPKERSGVGSALMQAFQKLGAPFGAAILGSALNSAYQSQLQLALPAAVAEVVRGSVFGGLIVAQRMHSASLLRMVREAFVYGMDSALLVSAGIAVAGLFVALAFMPQRTARVEDVAEYRLNPPLDLAEEPGVMG
jgi:MFS transporter, DHA2 family, multidrug resistance protein